MAPTPHDWVWDHSPDPSSNSDPNFVSWQMPVRMDGHGASCRGLRRNVSIALQENALFGVSVRDNIRYVVPDADDAQVQDAMRVACVDDYVASLPNGLDTVLSDRGGKLSTGQRQRLNIARAIVKDAPIPRERNAYPRPNAYNFASGVAQMAKPLLGNRISASTPSAERSAILSCGVRPDWLRNLSSPALYSDPSALDFYRGLPSTSHRNSYSNAFMNALCELSAAPACPPSVFS